jgi:hypothetical protein
MRLLHRLGFAALLGSIVAIGCGPRIQQDTSLQKNPRAGEKNAAGLGNSGKAIPVIPQPDKPDAPGQ